MASWPGEGEHGDTAGARVAGDAVLGAGPLVVLAPRREAAVRVDTSALNTISTSRAALGLTPSAAR